VYRTWAASSPTEAALKSRQPGAAILFDWRNDCQACFTA